MDGMRMIAAHCNGHSADAAGERASAHQAAAMQRFNTGTFFYAELAQSLGLPWREEIPFDAIDKGGLAQRKAV